MIICKIIVTEFASSFYIQFTLLYVETHVKVQTGLVKETLWLKIEKILTTN